MSTDRQLLPATPLTRALLIAFCAAAGVIAGASAVTLLVPGTALDGMWVAKPEDHRALLDLRLVAGPGFALLSAVLLAAAVGWYRRRVWGWGLSVAVIIADLLGDAAQLALRPEAVGVIPVLLAGAVLTWLVSRRVRPRRLEP